MKKLLLLIPLFLLTSCSDGDSEIQVMTLGKTNAPVLVEEFSDIQCPACGVISPAVEKIARNNPNLVQLKFYHFPLSYHEYAFMGAEATECANDQGKGWEYLANLYSNQNSLNEDYFYSLAITFDLNMEEFAGCLDDHQKKSIIQEQQKEGRVRQIPGTPSLFVNGLMIKWPGEEGFEAYLKSLAE